MATKTSGKKGEEKVSKATKAEKTSLRTQDKSKTRDTADASSKNVDKITTKEKTRKTKATKVQKSAKTAKISDKQNKSANRSADKLASKPVKPSVSDTYAIVKKGSAQYFLEHGALLEIPRINANEGKEYIFDEVLLASIKNELKIGTPVIKGAYVKVFVIKQVKGKKQRGFKYKAKSRYRRTWGYRKPTTRIRVVEIKA